MLDGTHTGVVVLYCGFGEQARHEHMSDEYKDRYIIRTLCSGESPSVMFCLLQSVASSPRRYTYLGCHLASVILLNFLLFFFLVV